MPRSDLVQSLLRGLDMLALVARSPDGLPLCRVADAMGLKAPTAHKLLRTLADRGFLERSSRPVRYRLGPAALELANAHWNSGLLERAPAVLTDVWTEIKFATVTLCEAVGSEVMTLLRISPERLGFVERPTNRVMAPYATAGALAFQAWWTEEERAAYRRKHPFWEQGTHIWDSLEEVDAFLAEVRGKGYAAPPFEAKGVCPVAAPIFGWKGVLRATVGASVPLRQTDASVRAGLIAEVTRAAEELSSGSD